MAKTSSTKKPTALDARYALPPDEHLMTEAEAGRFLANSPRSLQRWRLQGSGPEFIRIGQRGIRYTRGSLLRYAAGRGFTSTSHATVAQQRSRKSAPEQNAVI